MFCWESIFNAKSRFLRTVEANHVESSSQSNYALPTAPTEKAILSVADATTFLWPQNVLSPQNHEEFLSESVASKMQTKEENDLARTKSKKKAFNQKINNIASKPRNYCNTIDDFNTSLQEREHTELQLTESQARMILIENISKDRKHNCKVVEKMKIKSIQNHVIFRYSLKTLVERRWLFEVEQPFTSAEKKFSCKEKTSNQDIWRFKVDIFKDLSPVSFKIPNSSKMVACNRCSGKGIKVCEVCCGNGDTRCGICGGEGHKKTYEPTIWSSNRNQQINSIRYTNCNRCYGSGRERCCHCLERGRQSCDRCSGCGKQVKISQVTVEWSSLYNECYCGNLSIPKKIRKGLPNSKGFRLPLKKYIEDFLHSPEQYIYLHSREATVGRIRDQEQTIRRIPVYCVRADYKEREKVFWIVGREKSVYIF